MKRIVLSLFVSTVFVLTLFGQDFVSIWEGSTKPNSKGLPLKDSIANERVYQVATPGMYVFRPSDAENKGAAVLIIPGGGYVRLAYQISGWQLAKWFNTFGVTAFVLNHRFPQSPDVKVSYKAPLEDAQRAMRHIRRYAKEYGISPDRVGVMGSSAGGHLSACLSTITEDWGKGGDELDTYAFKPNFTILVSPVVSMREYAHRGSRENLLGKEPSEELLHLFSCDEQVTKNTSPAFMVHATDDNAVSSMNSILYYSALKKNGVPKSTIHIYPEGGHSISLRDNPGTTNTWPALAESWMKEIGMLE